MLPLGILMCSPLQALASYEARLDIVNIHPEAQWIVCGEGFTPLHLAALRGDFNTVKLLLAGHVQAMAAGAEVMAATAGQWGQRQAGRWATALGLEAAWCRGEAAGGGEMAAWLLYLRQCACVEAGLTQKDPRAHW
jgi:hypothetical protein